MCRACVVIMITVIVCVGDICTSDACVYVQSMVSN